MSTIAIHRFTSSDQGQVRDLITSIMSEEFGEEKAAYPTEDIEDIQRSYGGLGEAFFVASENHGKVIGTVAVKKEDDRVALLRRLFVAKFYRKKKIGLQLIDRALQFCDEVGYKEIIFRTTSRMEGAIKLCEKRGFIARAHIPMGAVTLLKFSLSLRENHKKAKV